MKKTMFFIFAALTFIASIVMYYVGSNSANLSELLDFYWVPLPLGLILLLVAIKTPQSEK